MRFQCKFADLLVFGDIDDCQGTVAVTDEQVLSTAFEPYIVGIVVQGDPTRFSVITAPIKPHRPITAICDIQHLGGGNVSHTLWLFKARDPVHNLRSEENTSE